MLNFLGARKAAVNLFQVDLDKLRNYLWYCYEQQWCWRWGCKRTHKSFELLKIWATSLKIGVKIAPKVAWLQKMAPKVCRKTNEDRFWKSHQSLNDLCGREFVGKSCTKNSSGMFGEIRAKILRNPKNLPAPKPMTKKHLSLRCSPFERTEGWMPRHASIIRRPCASVAFLGYGRHGSCHRRHFDGGAKITWQISKFVTCSFFNLFFTPNTTINCTATSIQRP